MSDGYLGNERLKRVGVELSFTEEQLKEIILCTQDPVYFINNYVKNKINFIFILLKKLKF